MLPITALYAALLALIFVVLSVLVTNIRRGDRIALGDGGNTKLQRRIRVQANFAEYVPLTLVLLALAEGQAWPAWLLHFCGIALVMARLSHAYGVSQTKEPYKFRVFGTTTTFLLLLLLAGLCGVAALKTML